MNLCVRLFIDNFKNIFKRNRIMSIFTQSRNPITGKTEWVSQNEDYDYHQEVARSAFADMLHDTERNCKYYAALKKAIKKIHSVGKEAHVLDIGTGTGILSMMAVKSGANSVTACEAFTPMANCAEKIIRANGMSHKIKLVRKRSQEMIVGKGRDMHQRANILVTEVFDTELIGEGAISVFNHAHKCLLTEDAIVIPSSATIYVQIVESPLANSWSKVKALADLDGDILLKPSSVIENCCGEAAVHDIQLSQFDYNNFKSICGPVVMYKFDWTKGKTRLEEVSSVRGTAESTALAQVIFFWWELQMDMDGEIILSCAPFWAHPEFSKLSHLNIGKVPVQNVISWRDHWMQAVYYLPKIIKLNQGQEFVITGHRDEWSFWFNVALEESRIPKMRCTCEIHTSYSRSRIGQLNNNSRNKKYLSVFENILSTSSKVLILSTGSLLCVSIARMGVESVTILEEHVPSIRITNSFIKENNINNVKIISNVEELTDLTEITHVIAEPYYIFSILPWDNFYFGTLLNKIRNNLNSNAQILPISATIYAMPVDFLDLHKIKAPLGDCEGFNLSIFDKFIEDSSELADAVVEPQPLWEYPCKALSMPQAILSIDFRNFMENKDNSGTIKIESAGCCNGVTLWVDWKLCELLSPKYIVSTGPQKPIEIGNWVEWDMYSKQGVHLYTHPKQMSKEHSIRWRCTFKPNEGEINFKFERQ